MEEQEKEQETANKGGKAQGKDTNPANLASDKEKAAAAGGIGGQSSVGGGRTSEDDNDE